MGTSHLPQRIVDLLSPDDRQEYALHIGHPNAGRSSSEIEQKITGRAERELQNQVRQYLNQKGVSFICPAMFRKSELPLGWPDFTFAYQGIPVLWECESLKGELRESQERVVVQLIRNGWRFRLIRSLEQARIHLRKIDQEKVTGKEAPR